MSVGIDDLGSLPFVNSTIPFVKDEVDSVNCRLLGGFAVIIQAGLALIVIASLLLKRARERPRRPFKVWTADVSKQVLGQIFVHFVNIAVSDLGARIDAPNACSHYFLNIVLDTTVGVFILYLFLQALTGLCVKRDPDSFKTGYYGRPFDIVIWAKQACVYVCALTLMKIVIVAFLLLVPGLGYVATWMISWAKDDETQVLFVMLVTPLVMNVLQFVLIDSILKSTRPEATLPKPDFAGDEEEGLLGRPSSDDHSPNPGAKSPELACSSSRPTSPSVPAHDESETIFAVRDSEDSQHEQQRRERSSSLQRKAAREQYPPAPIAPSPSPPSRPRSPAAPAKAVSTAPQPAPQPVQIKEDDSSEDWGFDDDNDWDANDEPSRPTATIPMSTTRQNGEDNVDDDEDDAWGLGDSSHPFDDGEDEKALDFGGSLGGSAAVPPVHHVH